MNIEKDLPIQTRSDHTGISNFATLDEAFEASKKDLTIWKISFALFGERVRLVRDIKSGQCIPVKIGEWVYEKL